MMIKRRGPPYYVVLGAISALCLSVIKGQLYDSSGDSGNSPQQGGGGSPENYEGADEALKGWHEPPWTRQYYYLEYIRPPARTREEYAALWPLYTPRRQRMPDPSGDYVVPYEMAGEEKERRGGGGEDSSSSGSSSSSSSSSSVEEPEEPRVIGPRPADLGKVTRKVVKLRYADHDHYKAIADWWG